jgi:hypothetical protein
MYQSLTKLTLENVPFQQVNLNGPGDSKYFDTPNAAPLEGDKIEELKKMSIDDMDIGTFMYMYRYVYIYVYIYTYNICIYIYIYIHI